MKLNKLERFFLARNHRYVINPNVTKISKGESSSDSEYSSGEDLQPNGKKGLLTQEIEFIGDNKTKKFIASAIKEVW